MKLKMCHEDHGNIEIVNFVKTDEFFEEKQVMDLVKINCEVDKLIENCDTAKVDAIVNVQKIKENMMMLKTWMN